MKFSECQARLHKRKAPIEGFPAAVLFTYLNCGKQTQIVPNTLLNPEWKKSDILCAMYYKSPNWSLDHFLDGLWTLFRGCRFSWDVLIKRPNLWEVLQPQCCVALNQQKRVEPTTSFTLLLLSQTQPNMWSSSLATEVTRHSGFYEFHSCKLSHKVSRREPLAKSHICRLYLS